MASQKRPPNVLIDLITGPNAPFPGVRYVTGLAARHVTTSRIVEQVGLLSPAPTYLTTDGTQPAGSLDAIVGGVMTRDFRYADRIALVAGGPATHYVWMRQVGLPGTLSVYYRTWIRPLPVF